MKINQSQVRKRMMDYHYPRIIQKLAHPVQISHRVRIHTLPQSNQSGNRFDWIEGVYGCVLDERFERGLPISVRF